MTAGPADPAYPVTLQVEQLGTMVATRVIGNWSEPFAADFALTIECNGNVVVHRSTVASETAQRQILSTSQAEWVGAGTYRSRLRVSPEKGEVYELEATL